MKSTETFFGVQITSRASGKPTLALGSQSGPSLHYWRRDAVKFKNGLREHGFKDAKVVKVRVTCAW